MGLASSHSIMPLSIKLRLHASCYNFLVITSRARYSLLNATSGVIARIFALCMMFFVRTALIFFLSEGYLGVEAVVVNMVQLLNMAEMGFGTAIAFRLYKPLACEDHNKIASYLGFYKHICYLIAIVIIAFALVMSAFLMDFMTNVDLPPLMIYAIFWLYVTQTASSYCLYAHRATIVQADQKVYIRTNFSSLGIVIGSIGQIVAYAVFQSYIGGLIFATTAQIASTLAVAHYAGSHYPYIKSMKPEKLSKEERKNIFKDIYALALIRVSNVANKSTPTLIVSYFLDAIKAGLYSNYLMIQNAVESLLLIAFSSITASVGNLRATSSEEAHKEAFRHANFLMFFVLTIAVSCVCVLTEPFIELVWGSSYALSQNVVFAICTYLSISGFLIVIATFKEASGIFWKGRYRPVIGVVLTIILAITLVNRFGIVGVVWATTISRLCVEAWFDPMLLYKYSFKDSPKKYFLATLCYLAIIATVCTITYVLCSMITLTGIAKLISSLLLAIIVPSTIVLVAFWKSPDLRYYKDILRKLMSRK